jgi:hypothetical protein
MGGGAPSAEDARIEAPKGWGAWLAAGGAHAPPGYAYVLISDNHIISKEVNLSY